jgi:lambda family phage tail tape measure protein
LENQKAQLELEGKFTEDARAQYDKRLSIIDEFQKKSIASYADYYSELMKKQGDWALGASEGLNNYLDDARNVFKQTENLVGDAFGGMEDALVNFVQTGKLSFGDLTKTIIADLARMEIKALASKIFGGGGSSGGSGSYLSSIGGALFSGYSAGSGGGVGLTTGGMSLADYGLAGGYADGGDPPVGKVSLVGERGPELFIPKTAGTIIPNDKLGGKATTITYAPVINIDSRTDRAQIQQDVQRQIQAGHAQLVDQLQRARVL